MVEAKAWLYEKGGKEHIRLTRPASLRHTDLWGHTETPLYGPEALAERDALIAELREDNSLMRGPEIGLNCPECACRVPADYEKSCPNCGTEKFDGIPAVWAAALKEKTDDAC